MTRIPPKRIQPSRNRRSVQKLCGLENLTYRFQTAALIMEAIHFRLRHETSSNFFPGACSKKLNAHSRVLTRFTATVCSRGCPNWMMSAMVLSLAAICLASKKTTKSTKKISWVALRSTTLRSAISSSTTSVVAIWLILRQKFRNARMMRVTYPMALS